MYELLKLIKLGSVWDLGPGTKLLKKKSLHMHISHINLLNVHEYSLIQLYCAHQPLDVSKQVLSYSIFGVINIISVIL